MDLHREHGAKHHEMDCFTSFVDATPLRPLVPERALDYFRGLLPMKGIDLIIWPRDLKRRAFTLAVETEETLLEKIQKLIAEKLESGKKIKAAPRQIAALLEEVGVSPRNPQYAEMVFRTNTRDSYLQGAQQQLHEVADYFPVWRYVGIRDGRQGHDHEPMFDQFYPSTTLFAEVRGKRVYNCRCDFIPLSAAEWRELRTAGKRIAMGYSDPLAA